MKGRFHKKIDFFVDDKKYFTFKNEGTGAAAWPCDKDQYLILNLAIGGGWGGQKGIDDSIFPQKCVIDYVRVYQKSLESKRLTQQRGDHAEQRDQGAARARNPGFPWTNRRWSDLGRDPHELRSDDPGRGRGRSAGRSAAASQHRLHLLR
jgi:hypothetical protein